MKGIEIISASAGSGKTYRLAGALADAIERDGVRPEGVVATTFTRNAAAELHERVRTRLLDKGLTVEAQRLSAARIGTVNSVCGRLVADFALELGLSPEVEIMSEEQAERAIAEAISAVLGPDEERSLQELSARLGDAQLLEAVGAIVAAARANGVTAAALARCAERSASSLFAYFDAPAGDAAELDAALVAAARTFVEAVEASGDRTKVTKDHVALARKALLQAREPTGLAWDTWMKLAGKGPGAKSRALAAPLQSAAAVYTAHPRFRADLGDAIRLVFGLAGAALDAYSERKRAMGAMDFVDQEVLALELLRRPDVRGRLAADLDLVLVDEFQDTSPVQLAVFVALAAIAGRSVWVGDQKQAIFGFRGTDPALMDAAIQAILGGEEPETLEESFRSRPGLVELTSALFAPAFAMHGIPESRTRLRPHLGTEPAGLGPCVEHWDLVLPDGNNGDTRAAALAKGVAELLEDESVRVRDPRTGRPVRILPGHVAVLCRTNDGCTRVAGALAALGIRAVLPRGGLLGTPEGALAVAGLRLWVDPGDTVARATLARLLRFADRPSEWLAEAVAHPGEEAFAGEPAVAAIAAARARADGAGPVEALDATLAALDALGVATRWGDAAQRIANLDALRSHAVQYVTEARARRAAFSPAGLLGYFEEIAGEEDTRAVPAGREDAVSISTWHRAKGLEWPVVVLFELESDKQRGAFGVQVVPRESSFDVSDPLAGRWIRFWPWKDTPGYDPSELKKRLASCDEAQAAAALGRRETLRLLYVGWTRARDRLVLAASAGKLLDEGILTHLQGEEGPLLTVPSEKTVWAGRQVDVLVRKPSPAQPVPRERQPGEGFDAPGPRDHPPAFLSPSKLDAGVDPAAVTTRVEEVGRGMALGRAGDLSAVGNAVHAFLAADRQELAAAERTRLAADLAARWGVPRDVFDPGALVAVSDTLVAFVKARWPTATWRREWPVEARGPDRSVLRGTIDLLLELEDGIVIIDHKTFAGERSAAAAKARGFAGQLGAYTRAASAALGKPVVGEYVHMPALGLVVELVGGGVGGAGVREPGTVAAVD